MNFQLKREQLLMGNTQDRLKSVTDLRERIEIVHTSEFSRFMDILFPVFEKSLYSHSPQMVDNMENKFRNVLLEILNRLPNNDVLKPFVPDLLKLAMSVLKVDNEDNGLICLRIIFDLHKNYRPSLEIFVQPFLDQVKAFYGGMEKTVQKVFYTSSINTTTKATVSSLERSDSTSLTESASASGSSSQLVVFLPSTESFKVLTECPLIVMLLFQLYGKYIESNIPDLIPLMMTALTLKTSDAIKNSHRILYCSLLACQVKTLSFLTYLLRGFAKKMRAYEDSIGSAVITLLGSCPAESVTTRKELLVATRHILATDFRKGFYNHIDMLADEKVLIGTGRGSHQLLRPLAYSTLADLVHHVRNRLSLSQVSNIIYIFSRNLHDATLPISIHTTCVRLLLNLVDFIYHNQDADPIRGRTLLVRILSTLVRKFGTLAHYIPLVILGAKKKEDEKTSLKYKGTLTPIKSSLQLGVPPVPYVESDSLRKRLVGSLPDIVDSPDDVMSLVGTMILGLKTVIWCLTNYRRIPDDSSKKRDFTSGSSQVAPNKEFPMLDDECILVSEFFESGIKCFLTYGKCAEKPLDKKKEVLDHFAGAFTALETPNFRDIFVKHMPTLFDCILIDELMLTIPQHFLANLDVSRIFADILLEYLISRLDDLSEKEDNTMELELFGIKKTISNSARQEMILGLFKIVFGSVTLFSQNETIMQPYLKPIVATCLRKTMEMKDPVNYYLLLRALFRSISGRKCDLFYTEFQPILPGLLAALIRLHNNNIDLTTNKMLLELCLTIPARLSSLLQYLPLLMRPLVMAIKNDGELVKVGLRTLEFWVDNLNPEFFFPIMSGQDSLHTELIQSLCAHLHPPPYPHGMLAMRLLGKLGGRNRRFLREPLQIEYREFIKPGFSMDIEWNESTSVVPFPMESVISSACDLLSRLLGSSDIQLKNVKVELIERVRNCSVYHKKQAVEFVIRVLCTLFRNSDVEAIKLFSRHEGGVDSNSIKVRREAIQECFQDKRTSAGIFPPLPNDPNRVSSRKAVVKMMSSLLEATTDSDVSEEATGFLHGIVRHFTLLMLSVSYRLAVSNVQVFLTKETAFSTRPVKEETFMERTTAMSVARFGAIHFTSDCCTEDIFVINQAIVDNLGSQTVTISEAAQDMIKCMVEVTTILLESPEQAASHGGALFADLTSKCLHACHCTELSLQLAGCRGIQKLCQQLDSNWSLEHHLQCIQAVLFVLGNHEPEVSPILAHEAEETLNELVLKCYPIPTDMEKDLLKEVELTREQEELMKMLISSLLKPNSKVRKQSLRMVESLASSLHCSVSVLMSPFQQELTNKVYAGSLRNLAPLLQIAYIETVSYGLNLAPPFFVDVQSVVLFLRDVWHLTSSDDPTIRRLPTSSGLSNVIGDIVDGQLYPCELAHSVRLRLAALDILRAAFIACPTALQDDLDTRNKFLGVFFRSLAGQPTEIVQAAQNGLSDIIHLHPNSSPDSIPKDLLQPSLRPVLLNLADYRKLTTSLLESLARLLTLLSPCFNVTLGEKLLEHLRHWEDPAKIIATKIWKVGEETKVAAAIVDLFHLLPLCETFLPPLISCVVALEQKLPQYGNYGRISSPFRRPLTKFLNRYAQQAVNYFLRKEHLLSPSHSSLFLSVLKYPEAKAIRNILTSKVGGEAILTSTFVKASKLSMPSMDVAEVPKISIEIDAKVQAQIQANANKAHAQAFSTAQQQGLTPAQAQSKARQAQAAYIAKAEAQVSAQQATKAQTQVNAQKVHAQTLAAAHQKGTPPNVAQVQAQKASSDYLVKMQAAQMRRSPAVSSSSSSSSHFQQSNMQTNAQKVYAQTLNRYQEQGLTLLQAQEHARKAQTSFVENTRTQEKITPTRIQSSIVRPSGQGPIAASNGQLDALELHFQGLKLVRLLSKLDPDWLKRQPMIVEFLRKLWKNSSRLQRLVSEDKLKLRYREESKLMVKCLIVYCRVNPGDVHVLFELLTVFLQRSLIDFSFLKRFYTSVVAKTYATSTKRAILALFLQKLSDPKTTDALNVQALQLLVLPMLACTFEDPDVNSAEVVDREIIVRIMKDVLGGALPDYSESLRIELLQMATLLIQHIGDALLDHRKDLIKFAWNHLKSEDTTSKQWAYVDVCRFIQVYETPPKIILQVYVALLRTYQAEARVLVRIALDILTPSLPKRLPSEDFIKAIKWTKKIIYEEGHAIQQLVHIWQHVVRQPGLFYDYRAHFVPQMVNSLNRLALPPNSPLENKTLAVALVDLIISWDQVRKTRIASRKGGEVVDTGKRPALTSGSESPSKKLKSSTMPSVASSSMNVSEESLTPRSYSKEYAPVEAMFELNPTMVDMIVNFLVRFSLGAADVKETEALVGQCIDLFSISLQMYPKVKIKSIFFEKLLTQSSSTTTTDTVPSKSSSSSDKISVNALKIVLKVLNIMLLPSVISEQKNIPFVLVHASKLQRILESCFDVHDEKLQESFQKFIVSIMKVRIQ